jgi:hypothetical protein
MGCIAEAAWIGCFHATAQQRPGGGIVQSRKVQAAVSDLTWLEAMDEFQHV